MDQQGLALLHVERHRPGQRAAGRRIGDRELDRLDEADVLRLGEDIDLVRHGLLGQPAPVEHGHDLVADLELLAGPVDLGDHARRLGAGREGEAAAALVLAGDHQCGGKAHARRMHLDAHLTGLERRRSTSSSRKSPGRPLAADHGTHVRSNPFEESCFSMAGSYRHSPMRFRVPSPLSFSDSIRIFGRAAVRADRETRSRWHVGCFRARENRETDRGRNAAKYRNAHRRVRP